MLTIGAIARSLGLPVHRIEYIVLARNIKPSGRAGTYRLYSPADVKRIKLELRKKSG